MSKAQIYMKKPLKTNKHNIELGDVVSQQEGGGSFPPLGGGGVHISLDTQTKTIVS